ncbi:MAG: hypothetical protein JO115_02800 [Pseudonocardiales bacterium]|nr:hypothetical protein [Pseudonocardiales bacterium]
MTTAWGCFGLRRTHPADRTVGCSGVAVTEQPTGPMSRRQASYPEPGSAARAVVLE